MQRKKKRKKDKKPKTSTALKVVDPPKPQPPKTQMKIIPYSVIRDAMEMPFRPGQGVTLVGWQFEIMLVSPDGTIALKPIGRIVPDDAPSIF